MGAVFDAFGDQLEVEPTGHGHDGIDDAGITVVSANVADERTVDLECANRELLQVAQRRVTGSEVIHSNGQTALTHLFEFRNDDFHVLHQGVLSNLKLDGGRFEAGRLQIAGKALDKRVLFELSGG